MGFRNILCPVDFSPGSDDALRVAARLAGRDRAELVIAHAWNEGDHAAGAHGAPAASAELLERMIDDDERALDAAVHAAQRLGAERARALLLTGYPSEELIEALRGDPTFDLVVIGTRRRTGVLRVVLGSVAEDLVRRAPCSVLVTRERAEVAAFRRVLCAIDFSDSSRPAMELAAAILDPGGDITVLHGLELPLAHGNPGARLLAMLGDDPTYDLVVTGSHGPTGIRRAFVGAVVEKIVHHAPCPVLVARPRRQA